MIRLYHKEIGDVISQASIYLKENERTIIENGKTIHGWHQHLGSNKIGVVATAMAILFFKNISKHPIPNEDDCLQFILDMQHADGGWGFITNTDANSNLLATCWAIRTLSLYANIYQAAIDKGLKWIFDRKSFGKGQDSGWSLYGAGESQTFATCFALQTIKELKKDNEYNATVQSALQWLRETQDDSGAWRQNSAGSHSVFMTAMAVMTLGWYGKETDKKFVEKGLQCIKQRIDERGLASNVMESEMELVEETVDGKRLRTPYFHYTIPYVVCAFMFAGHGDDVTVIRCLRLLKERMNNGHWKHPFIEDEDSAPIWALYDSVLAFCQFKEYWTYRDNKYTGAKAWYNKSFAVSYYRSWRSSVIRVRPCNPLRIYDLLGTELWIKIMSVALLSGVFYLGITNFDTIQSCMPPFWIAVLESLVAALIMFCLEPILTWVKTKLR